MTPLAEPATVDAPHTRMLWLICAAHFVSHVYVLILAPVFPLIRADFGVSYTQLGLALTAFNLVSALLTTPAGYLVDRHGARPVLIGGLLVGAAALAGAALLHSFWGFVAMFALLGLGNTVYHPADYALLSRRVPPRRMGHAFAIHAFAGMAGSAAAPPVLLVLANAYGWRGAYAAAALGGFAVALLLVVFARDLHDDTSAGTERGEAADKPAEGNRRLLTSTPVILNLVIFALLAVMSSGVQNFSIVALQALRGVPLDVANAGLSIHLVMSAIGVLAGGFVASRTTRHDLAAQACLVAFGLPIFLIGAFDLNMALVLALMGLAGFAIGAIMPSRDMLVRAVTPPAASGRVFGFVTNGFNIAGMVTPVIFGWLMDHGHPAGVFLVAAAFAAAILPLVVLNRPGRTA